MGDIKVQSYTDITLGTRAPQNRESVLKDADQTSDGPQGRNRIDFSLKRPHHRRGLTGGYYWFPTHYADGITWSVVTCHDLNCAADAGHDVELWPKLITLLAGVWAKDARLLKRSLGLSYTGLPRGRVTRPDKKFLILHGNDSPVPVWQIQVAERFGLAGCRVRAIFDEHETMIPGHPQAVEVSLGVRFHAAES
jgi:hypothetical protein